MDKEIESYKATQKTRSCLGLFSLTFIIFLSGLFILVNDLIFNVIGYLLIILIIGGFYSLIQNDIWVLSIDDHIISWDYSRWPNDKGEIHINDLNKIRINDFTGKLTFYFKSGNLKTVNLTGFGFNLVKYLRKNYPKLELEYKEDT